MSTPTRRLACDRWIYAQIISEWGKRPGPASFATSGEVKDMLSDPTDSLASTPRDLSAEAEAAAPVLKLDAHDPPPAANAEQTVDEDVVDHLPLPVDTEKAAENAGSDDFSIPGLGSNLNIPVRAATISPPRGGMTNGSSVSTQEPRDALHDIVVQNAKLRQSQNGDGGELVDLEERVDAVLTAEVRAAFMQTLQKAREEMDKARELDRSAEEFLQTVLVDHQAAALKSPATPTAPKAMRQRASMGKSASPTRRRSPSLQSNGSYRSPLPGHRSSEYHERERRYREHSKERRRDRSREPYSKEKERSRDRSREPYLHSRSRDRSKEPYPSRDRSREPYHSREPFHRSRDRSKEPYHSRDRSKEPFHHSRDRSKEPYHSRDRSKEPYHRDRSREPFHSRGRDRSREPYVPRARDRDYSNERSSRYPPRAKYHSPARDDHQYRSYYKSLRELSHRSHDLLPQSQSHLPSQSRPPSLPRSSKAYSPSHRRSSSRHDRDGDGDVERYGPDVPPSMAMDADHNFPIPNPPTVTQPEEHTLTVPGVWAFCASGSTADVLECSFTLDNDTAAQWSVYDPDAPRAEYTVTQKQLHLQLYCVPLMAARGDGMSDVQVEWPKKGLFVVEVNRGTSVGRMFVPDDEKPLPVNITHAVQKGLNVVRFIQLVGMESAFIIHASEETVPILDTTLP